MSEVVCTQCGQPINLKRDSHYGGERDGVPYIIHPACYAEWVMKRK